jgi:hypothetical protein
VIGPRDRELEARLRGLRAPDEDAAEERSLAIVRAAYADHVPLRPSRGARRFGVAVACGAAALAIGLSPAGARVGDLVSDVFSNSPGEPHAKPTLRALPAPGQLLVDSTSGIWIVRDDGSRRRLGSYDEASWSPHGLYVIAAKDRTLTALSTDGDVQWTFPTPGVARDPRWTGSTTDTRIAYRSGHDLRVIVGNGDPATDRLIAHDVAPAAPAWRPHGFVVAYIAAGGAVHAVDVDTGERVPVTPGDRRRLSPSPATVPAGSALAPDGQRVASIERSPTGRARLTVSDAAGGGGTKVLFLARGRLTGPTWSPDGRWLLIGWPAADQWLFVNADHPKDIWPFDAISRQFDSKRFPRVSGWILPPD